MKKNLYKVTVLNFLPFGGKEKIYWVYAYSKNEAGVIVARKFNKDFHFDLEKNYVDMRIKEVKKWMS